MVHTIDDGRPARHACGLGFPTTPPNKPLKLSARVSKECKHRQTRVIYRGQTAPSLAPD